MSRHRADNPNDRYGRHADYGRDELFDAELDDVSAFWTSTDEPTGPRRRWNAYAGPDVEWPRFLFTRRQRIALYVGVPTLCVLLCVVVMVSSALTVVGQAEVAKESASGLLSGMKTGNAEVVEQNVESLTKATTAMRIETASPIWQFVSYTPIVGTDIYNARAIVRVLDDVVCNGLGRSSDRLAGISMSSLVHDGVINVDGMQSVVMMLGDMAPSLKRADETFSVLKKGVVAPLNTAIEQGKSMLDTVVVLADDADILAEHVPDMLGANGEERNYLVLAQSNAELRSVGGFPGSWGRLTIKDGKLELGDFSSPQQIRQSIDVADDEKAFFNDGTVDMVTTVGVNPNYPRVAEVISQIYSLQQEEYGGGYLMVDGIVALDPLFLADIMKLTNSSVKVSKSRIDGSNAAEFILSRIYWDLPVRKQDKAFSKIAKKAFSLLTGGLGDVSPSDLMSLIKKGAENRDFMMWFRDADEQDIVSDLGLTGSLHNDPAQPYLGVYLNDVTYSKMDWYINAVTEYGEPEEQADGTKVYHVTTTIENHMTPEEAETAPDYVVGGGHALVTKRGQMLTNVFFFAPAGGKLLNISIDDPQKSVYSKEFYFNESEGHDVASMCVRTNPLESVVFTYDVSVSQEAEEPMQLDTTPTPQYVAGWKKL